MKYIFQWKDPDFNCGNEEEITDKEQRKLDKLGIDEYLVVEVDTDKMTAEVILSRGVGPL